LFNTFDENLNKMKKQFLFTALLALAAGANAQTTRVQVIHNCADLAADSVDVYLNGSILLDNFAFRTATPFVDVTAGSPITLSVAPKNSMSVADTFFSTTVTLDPTRKYILVANGIESATGYAPGASTVPFRLSVSDIARESAASSGNTDLLVMHGATDAPVVDVRAGNTVLVNDIAFGQYNSTGYLPLPTADYIIDVTDATGGTVVKRYSAPLATWSLTGGAATIVASGFLNPSVNSSGAPFGLWAAPAAGGALRQLDEVARVQVIHNCADRAADSVDIYLNGIRSFDNVAFRTNTSFFNAPVGTPINIGIAPKNSTSVTDTFFNTTVTLTSDKRYILVAQGIESATGYAPGASTVPFRLSVYTQGREISRASADTTDILVVHGCTDAPAVDVRAGSAVLVNDITFGNFAGYLSLPTANYTLDITDAPGTTTVARYSAPLSTLGLDGDAITVLASGFLDPTDNSSGSPFGLWVALPTAGALVPLPSVPVSVTGMSAGATASVFPNPATNTVTVRAANGTTMKKVWMTDITGRTIAAKEATNNAEFLINTLSPGMYLMNVENNDGRVETIKVVKE
jgi:hypothetical protein